MMTFEEIRNGIRPADGAAMERAFRKWDSLAKPLGSLGMLEEMVIRIAGITGDEDVSLDQRELLVFCADNGVVAKGVSQTDSSVTAAVAEALGRGTSTSSYLARAARCGVLPVDIGMLAHEPFDGVLDRNVRRGTADITEGPAMTAEECAAAIGAGFELARERQEAGDAILLAGEMGIGNTTTSTAVACVLLGKDAEEMTGRGAGLSDAGLSRKTAAVREAVLVNRPDAGDPFDVLRKVGGLDLAALCGLCLGGAYYRIPVLLDGMITLTAALCAVRICPECRFALLASHVSAEPSVQYVLRELALKAPIAADMRLGEGSGALMALSLLDMTLGVYQSGHTFEHLGIEAYRRQK